MFNTSIVYSILSLQQKLGVIVQCHFQWKHKTIYLCVTSEEDTQMFDDPANSYPGIAPCTSYEQLIHFLVTTYARNVYQALQLWNDACFSWFVWKWWIQLTKHFYASQSSALCTDSRRHYCAHNSLQNLLAFTVQWNRAIFIFGKTLYIHEDKIISWRYPFHSCLRWTDVTFFTLLHTALKIKRELHWVDATKFWMTNVFCTLFKNTIGAKMQTLEF